MGVCVEVCCTFDGVVELEAGFVVPSLRLDLPAPLVVVETREVAETEIVDAPVLPIQEREVVKAIPAMRVNRGADRLV